MSVDSDNIVAVLIPEDIRVSVEDIPEITVEIDRTDEIFVIATGAIGNPGPQGEPGATGPPGLTGPKGDTGAQGPKGDTGAQGPAGTGIYMKGSVPTASALPPTGNSVGDAYIANDTNHLWVWDGTKWVDSGNIQGPAGPTGPQGATGAQGTPGEKWFTAAGVPIGTLPSSIVGDWYIDTATGDYYEKTGATTWTLRGNLRGPIGATGPQGVKGDTGAQGSTGSQGATGATGAQGPAGTPGSKIYATTSAPGSGNNPGDVWINPSDGNVYDWGIASPGPPVVYGWIPRGNIKGPTGATGSTGPTGAAGTPGEKWYLGAVAPSTGLGIVGDLYLNTATYEYYEKTGTSTWTLTGLLKGAAGTPGDPGEKWSTGSGAPLAGASALGDWYIDKDTGDYYEKTTASSWTLRGNLKGPQGIQGIQGIQGATGTAGTNGTNGEKWFTGSGVPSGGLSGSVVGDWYLDSATGDYYEKTGASVWTARGNIKGVKGDPGEKWFSGSGVPAGGLAGTIVGDWYLDVTAGDVYEKTASSIWTVRGNIKGPTGAQGIQGIQGATGTTGSQGAKGDPGEKWFSISTGTPSSALGVTGDWCIVQDTGNFYEKIDSTNWVLRGSLKGPTGATGNAGAVGATGPEGNPGELWFSGSGAPAGAMAGPVVGDWYLDTTTGDVYEKTGASTWTLRANIKGPQGATGATGAQGPQGPAGDISKTIVDAKGDLIAGTGPDAVARVASPGINAVVLEYDAVQGAADTGLRYTKLYDAQVWNDPSNNLNKLARVTGTPNGTKFLRDDGQWITPAGGGSGAIDVQVFTVSGTWTKPAGCTVVEVIVVGAGGGGGGGVNVAIGNAARGGSGGGAGGVVRAKFAASDLGATEVVSVASAPAAQSTGGSSEFGDGTTVRVRAYGGGSGVLAATGGSGNVGGGAGGSVFGVGGDGASSGIGGNAAGSFTGVGRGGSGSALASPGQGSMGGGGGGTFAGNTQGGSSESGGAGGGGGGETGVGGGAGGNAVNGPGGGGGGASRSSANANLIGGNGGGASSVYTANGSGPAAASTAGAAGVNGGTRGGMGQGGSGGAAGTSAAQAGGKGGDGGAPGGGGGGGGGGNPGGVGGAGGRGQVTVISW